MILPPRPSTAYYDSYDLDLESINLAWLAALRTEPHLQRLPPVEFKRHLVEVPFTPALRPQLVASRTFNTHEKSRFVL